MKIRYHSSYCMLLSFWCCAIFVAKGQSPAPNKLAATVKSLGAIRAYKPIEKLYLQTDKPNYTVADTLRFKAYLLQGDFLVPSVSSGLLYVELDNASGKPAQRIMVPVIAGLAWGDIALDEKQMPPGDYTLRAYTNWMRNFGEDYIFQKPVTVAATAGSTMLVKANFKQADHKVEGVLQFTALDGRVRGFKDIQLKVMNGSKNLAKDKLTTGPDGTLKVNFDVPANTAIKDLSIQAQEINNGGGAVAAESLNIPVVINRLNNIDLQFMPEGGNLVAGISSKIGFKVINEDGKGVDAEGRLYDSKQQEAAQFKTIHAGMGSLLFTPKAGETYTAKINGLNKSFALPAVSPTGIALQLNATDDSLRFTLTASPGNTITNGYLVGQARGVVCYAQAISFNALQNQIKVAVAKELFPTGIARFSLLDANQQPVNERQVFINHQDNLNITINPQQPGYGIRDSVSLAIIVKDKNGKPVQGSFSLAVTDDSQVKTDSLAGNILSNMLLTSDLKGYVEEPGYYFTRWDKNKAAALDNLLLTQGWIGYAWKDVIKLDPKPLSYVPEKEFTVNGRVSNAFGKPIEKSGVVLVANHPLLFKDTLTNKDGRFSFKGIFPVDTAVFKIQARNKNGKEMNVRIQMDETKWPQFGALAMTRPWYLNSDSILLNNSITKTAQAKALSEYRGEGTVLKEVNINAKKIIKGSANLNGPGEADQTIDEEELKKAERMTLGDLLFQKIKGFAISGFTPPKREYPPSLDRENQIRHDYPWMSAAQIAKVGDLADRRMLKPWRMSYKIGQQEVHFIIDGTDLDFFFEENEEVFVPFGPYVINDTKRYLYIKRFLDYFTAEDITGIELMSGPKYAAQYNVEFDRSKDRPVSGRPNDIAYLEITTRSKQGPFLEVTPGTYLYKTLPFTLAKQFYSPQYPVKDNAALGTDRRSTIFWEPNIKTDDKGTAHVSFYTADQPSNYSVIIEGTTADGNLGYQRQTVRAAKP